MTDVAQLEVLGLFDQRVPRYTSYPTAPVFAADVGAEYQADCLRRLDPREPVSVYIHVPFCERLCWFCACRTQGTRTLSPVEAYVTTLEAELALLARQLPAGVRMGRLHWGGGTPTILPPELIHRLARALKAVLPPADPFEFSVEIDPTMVDAAKIAALRAEGMTRASIGIQDFSPRCRRRSGVSSRSKSPRAASRTCASAGIASLNADLVYGLPHQTRESVAASVRQVLALEPDRLALFGYAHVPWMSTRQKLIDEAALPDDGMRHELASLVATMLTEAGFDAIGIDHFARRDDGLSRAAAAGALRRNFQGYTDDTCPTLIGIGASSISRFEQGYVQNAAATGAYTGRIEAGQLAGYRGHAMSQQDLLRARTIEMLMCDLRIDLAELEATFGDTAAELRPIHAEIAARFHPFVAHDAGEVRLAPDARPLTRLVARAYDAYDPGTARYSRAS